MELRYVFVFPRDPAVDCIRNCIALPGYHVRRSHLRRRLARSRAQLPAAVARSDLAGLPGSAIRDHPRFEVAILLSDARWTAGCRPGRAVADVGKGCLHCHPGSAAARSNVECVQKWIDGLRVYDETPRIG